MDFDFRQNFFELFGLPQRFRIDEAALTSAWHALQQRAHPDRYVQASDAEKRQALQWATFINEGLRTLREPLSRAQYLLRLAGIDAGVETNTAMAPEFLMQQMEWREAVEDAREQMNADALIGLLQRLQLEEREMLADLAESLDGAQDFISAGETVRRLMFMRKLRVEIDDALETLEN